MAIRLAFGAYLFALGGCVATSAIPHPSALWWGAGSFVAAVVVMLASGG